MGHTLEMGQRIMKGENGMNHQTKTPFPMDPAFAIAYVRWQTLSNVYEPEEALGQGTLFPELNKPFYGRRARYGMQKCR